MILTKGWGIWLDENGSRSFISPHSIIEIAPVNQDDMTRDEMTGDDTPVEMTRDETRRTRDETTRHWLDDMRDDMKRAGKHRAMIDTRDDTGDDMTREIGLL
jgi:hypothetical protein